MKPQIMNFVTMKICFIKPGHYSTFLNKYCELQKVSAEALPMVLTSNHKSQCSCKWPNDELLDLLSIPSIFTVFTVSLYCLCRLLYKIDYFPFSKPSN